MDVDKSFTLRKNIGVDVSASIIDVGVFFFRNSIEV